MEGKKDGIYYVLFCFQNTEYVAYLLSSIVRVQDVVLIHCDIKAPANLKNLVHRLSTQYRNIVKLDARDYSWAGYSHVAVCIDAIGMALQRGDDWSHIVFLSEQHLPLKAPDAIASALAAHGSMVTIYQANQMGEVSLADIKNRFSAEYRELPGVGSFAVRLTPRSEDFYDSIFHGSNWMALSRDHCNLLHSTEGRDALDRFKAVVHAEEMAIQSIIASSMEDKDKVDVTCVAWPHLSDNHDLVMTEELFTKNIDSNYLFIRKRIKQLPPKIDSFIKKNYFRFDIYNCMYATAAPVNDSFDRATHGRRQEILKQISDKTNDNLEIIQQCRPHVNPSSAINIAFKLKDFDPNYIIRIISENLTDYKVCILKNPENHDKFQMPFIRRDALHSTARVKLYGVFSHEDILPLNIGNSGFVTLAEDGDCHDLIATFEAMVDYLRSLPVEIAS